MLSAPTRLGLAALLVGGALGFTATASASLGRPEGARRALRACREARRAEARARARRAHRRMDVNALIGQPSVANCRAPKNRKPVSDTGCRQPQSATKPSPECVESGGVRTPAACARRGPQSP